MNKLTCKDACLLLSLYIDDMLSDEEMTQVREHLEECDSCRNEYILLKGIMDNSTHLECPELSDTFKTGLHEKLLQESQLMEKQPDEEEKPVTVVPSVRKWRIYPYIAAGAAAIVISVLALSNLPDSDSFISDMKNEVVESAIPMQTQNAESEESVEPALESSSPEPTSANDETSEPAEDNEAINADEQTLEVNNAMVTSADEEKSDIKDELKAESEETMRSLPKMASFEEDVVNEEVLEEDTDGAENDMEIAAVSGGGSSAAIDEKVRVSVIFSFNHDSIEQVREVMSGVSSRGSVYEVPISSLSEYVSLLESIDGYISHRQVEEDYTAEYGLLEKNGDRFGRKAQIDEYTQKATIIIGS